MAYNPIMADLPLEPIPPPTVEIPPLPPSAKPRHSLRSETPLALSLTTPAKVESILASIAQGLPIRTIAKRHACHVSTVYAVINQAQGKVAAWPERTAEKARQFIEQGIERLQAEVGKVPLASLPIAIGILTDKLATLAPSQALTPQTPRADTAGLLEALNRLANLASRPVTVAVQVNQASQPASQTLPLQAVPALPDTPPDQAPGSPTQPGPTLKGGEGVEP